MKFCPITKTKCVDNCALLINGDCAHKLIADLLFHISIDTSDIVEAIESGSAAAAIDYWMEAAEERADTAIAAAEEDE